MLALFFGMRYFCYCFVFVWFFVLLSNYEKKASFPCNLSYVGKEVIYLLCFMIWFLLFCFLVLFVCSLNNEVVMFCICVILFVTKISGFLFAACGHRVSFLLFCYELLFSLLSKKKRAKGHGKNQNKCRKKRHVFFRLEQWHSQLVFRFFEGGLKHACLSENTIQIVALAYFEKVKWPKIAKKVESKLVPRLSHNLVQACCAT